MDKALITYYKDGITSNKLPTGIYSIFTIKTQRFTVDTLEELTPQSFIDATEQLKKTEEMQAVMMKELENDITLQKKIEECSIENINFDYFKSIINLPLTNKIKVKNGDIVDVGDEYILKFNNDVDVIVYIHSVFLLLFKRIHPCKKISSSSCVEFNCWIWNQNYL